jgi:predicted small metal-binding protein
MAAVGALCPNSVPGSESTLDTPYPTRPKAHGNTLRLLGPPGTGDVPVAPHGGGDHDVIIGLATTVRWIMAYSLRCADSGADCPGAFTTETEDEMMQHVRLHASVAHPDMELTPETVEQLKGLVRAE